MTNKLHENIEQLIHSLSQNDFSAAEQTFNSIMSDKINVAIENMKVDSADDMFNYQGAIAEEYSEKNPKIDLHNKINGLYLSSTHWSPTVKHAVAAYEAKYPEMKGSVRGYKAERQNVREDTEELNEGARSSLSSGFSPEAHAKALMAHPTFITNHFDYGVRALAKRMPNSGSKMAGTYNRGLVDKMGENLSKIGSFRVTKNKLNAEDHRQVGKILANHLHSKVSGE